MTTVPPEAIEAAAQSVASAFGAEAVTRNASIIRYALAAAAPLIAAEERERIRQLADDCRARYPVRLVPGPGEEEYVESAPFASLLTDLP